jgi:hypothetical protein
LGVERVIKLNLRVRKKPQLHFKTNKPFSHRHRELKISLSSNRS